MFCDEWKKDQFLLSSHLYKSSDFPELFVQSTSLGSQGSAPTPERKKHFFFTRPSLLPFHLLLCHSLTHNSIALRRFFTPLFSPPSLTSISIFPLAPCLLFHLTPPPSLSGMRGTGLVHLRVMALWQAETSAPSPGHAAVPALCNAYHPTHTSTQNR